MGKLKLHFGTKGDYKTYNGKYFYHFVNSATKEEIKESIDILEKEKNYFDFAYFYSAKMYLYHYLNK